MEGRSLPIFNRPNVRISSPIAPDAGGVPRAGHLPTKRHRISVGLSFVRAGLFHMTQASDLIPPCLAYESVEWAL